MTFRNLVKNPNDISVTRIHEELYKRNISHYYKEATFDKKELPNFSDDNLVVVSPIHSLKGLEFDYIIFPHTEYADLWIDPYVRENLLFVLFTRARQQVYCSYVDEDKSYIWNRIKDQKALDYIEKVEAKDIINPSIGNSEAKFAEDISI